MQPKRFFFYFATIPDHCIVSLRFNGYATQIHEIKSLDGVLARLFETLYTSLARGARAVFQFYPKDEHQIAMITGAALGAGFSGGLVVDHPNSTKAKKFVVIPYLPCDPPTILLGIFYVFSLGA